MSRHTIVVLFFLISFNMVSLLPTNCLCQSPGSGTAFATDSRRILVLYSYNHNQKAQKLISDGLESAGEKAGFGSDVFIHEFLDISPPKNPEQIRIIRQLILNKYSDQKFDLIITVFNGALDFLFNELRDLSPGSSCIALYGQEKKELERGGRKVLQSPLVFDIAGTLKLALKLFPETSHVLFVSGNSELDMAFEKKARAEFVPWQDRIVFQYTSHLSLHEILKQAGGLPGGSIVIYSRITSDATGKTYNSGDIADRVAEYSRAPVFCLATSQLDSGAVGGSMIDTDGLSAMLGRSFALLGADEPMSIEPASNFIRPMLNWQQVERWRINPDFIPSEAIIINRPETLWHRYRTAITAAFVIFTVQTIMILCLVAIYRKQKKLKQDAQQNELLFRSLFDLAPYSVTINDMSGRYVMVNQYFMDDKNMTKEEVLGKTVMEVVGDVCDHDSVEKMKLELVKNGIVKNRIILFNYPDRIAASIFSSRIIQFREASHFLSISVDISELRQTQEALNKSEEKFRKIVENLPIAIGISSYDGKITYQNPFFTGLFGYYPEEIPTIDEWIEKAYPDLEYRKRTMLLWKSDIEWARNHSDAISPARVYEITAKDGKKVEVEISFTIIQNEIYTVFHDVTEQKNAERELRESEEKYRILFDNSADAYALLEDGIIIEHNRGAADMFRCGYKNLTGRSPVDISPEYQPCGRLSSEYAVEIIDKIYQKGSFGFEWMHRKDDGTDFWTDINASVISIKGRKVLFAVWRDITDKKLAEEAARESHKRSVIQRAAIAGLAIRNALDDEDLSKVMANATEVMSEVIGTARSSIWKLVSDRKLECIDLYESEQKKHSSGSILDSATFPSYFSAIMAENRLNASDAWNDPRTAELMGNYLEPLGITSLLDAGIIVEGRLIGVASCEHTGPIRKWHSDEESFISTVGAIIAQTFANIERKKALEALRKSEERYRSIIRVSNTGTWEYHADTGFAWCSPIYFEMIGLDPDDFILDGHPNLKEVWTDYLHPDDLEKASEVFRDYVSKGMTGMYENIFRMKHRKGGWVWIFARGQFLLNQDGSRGNIITGTHIDITEIKEAQQIIAEKNRELEQIVYVTSHDLRSPLVNVDGYGRELEYSLDEIRKAFESFEEPESRLGKVLAFELPDMGQSLKHIRNSTRQMDSLLKGLLKLSRSGRAALHIEVLDMNDLIGRIVNMLDFQTGEAGAEIYTENLPSCLGDNIQISQVFTNIIVNALKYADPGRPAVIKISGFNEKTMSVYCVEDNGIGIAPEHQEKIFELFHRLDPLKSEGEGLGLTIVRQILKRLDGEIRVESKQGKGSKFYVHLPSAKV